MLNNKFFKKVSSVAILSLVLWGAASGNFTNTVNASSEINGIEVSTAKEIAGTKVDGKYSTIARFTEGVSSVSTLSASDSVKWYDSNSADDMLTVDLSKLKDSDKGKFGVKYDNIAVTADGTKLGLKVTVTDWKGSDATSFLRFNKTSIAMIVPNWAVHTKYTYYNEATGEDYKVSGYFTFDDVDGRDPNVATSQGQNITIYKDSVPFTDKIIFSDDTDDDTKFKTKDLDGSVELQNDSDGLTVSGVNGPDANDDGNSAFAAFTVLFSETPTYDFIFNVDPIDTAAGSPVAIKDISKSEDDVALDNVVTPEGQVDVTDRSGGAWYGYVFTKPAATEETDPKKTVTDVDEENVESDHINSVDESFEYNIRHNVPFEDGAFFHTKYEFTDKLADVLELEGVTITNEAGDDVTDKFEDQSDGNNLKFVANAGWVHSIDFALHTYQFNVKVHIKKGADLSKYTDDKNQISIANTANIALDDESKDTNTVTTLPPNLEKGTSPVKKILDGDKLVDSLKLNPGDNVTYQIEGVVRDFNEFMNSIKNNDKDDSSSSSESSSSSSESSNSSSASESDSESSSSSDDSSSTSTAKLKVREVKEDAKSNDELAKEESETTDEDTSKTDETDSTEETKHVFTIQDDLDDNQDLKDVKIFDGDKDITDQFDITRDDDKESFVATYKGNGTELVGHNIKAQITAQVKEDADFSKYEKDSDGNYIIPNTGSFGYDGELDNTNTTEVLVPEAIKKLLPQTGIDNKALVVVAVLSFAGLISAVWYSMRNRKKI